MSEKKKPKITIIEVISKLGKKKVINLIHQYPFKVSKKGDPNPDIVVKYKAEDDPRNRATRRRDDAWARGFPSFQRKQKKLAHRVNQATEQRRAEIRRNFLKKRDRAVREIDQGIRVEKNQEILAGLVAFKRQRPWM